MRRLLVLGILLAARSASAGSAEFAPSAEGLNFTALRTVAQRPAAGETFAAAPNAYGAPIYTIPLAPLLDGVRANQASFRAGNAVVHVFGGMSENKDNWFVGFATEDGAAQFHYWFKMLHYSLLLISHTVHFQINGRSYAAYIEGHLDYGKSRIVVVPADKNEARSSWTAQELFDASYVTGVPVEIGGKEYRLMYTRDFDEDKHGEFGDYNGHRSITLVTREYAYHWFESEIPSDRILVSTPKAMLPRGSRPGTLTVGLRLNGGALEIYWPAAASVARN